MRKLLSSLARKLALRPAAEVPPKDVVGDLGMNTSSENEQPPEEVDEPKEETLASRLDDLKEEFSSPGNQTASQPEAAPPSPVSDVAPPEEPKPAETLPIDYERQQMIEALGFNDDGPSDGQSPVVELNSQIAIEDDIASLKSQIEGMKESVDFLIRENGWHTEARLKQQELEDKALHQTIEMEDLRKEIHDLRKELEQRELRDGFYEGMLGIVLGQSVESLRQENFQALMQEIEENLNRLFREEIPSSDGLKELEGEAAAVSDAFQTAFEKMCALNGQMEAKLRQYVDRANQVAADLKQFSSQLACRQLSLNVRVSAHAGARDAFLAELGTAIKRVVDKLRDPQAYWQRELERVATADVIAAVDAYDKERARSHGWNGEVEKSLSELFAQARLSPIMPATGDPFRPADQDMIRAVPGPTANSQKISRVVSRGFNYLSRDGQKRLIRKAVVEIYL